MNDYMEDKKYRQEKQFRKILLVLTLWSGLLIGVVTYHFSVKDLSTLSIASGALAWFIVSIPLMYFMAFALTEM